MKRSTLATFKNALLLGFALVASVDVYAAGRKCREIFQHEDQPPAAVASIPVRTELPALPIGVFAHPAQDLLKLRMAVEAARARGDHAMASLLYRQYQDAYRAAVAIGLDVSLVRTAIVKENETRETKKREISEAEVSREWLEWTPGLVLNGEQNYIITSLEYSADGSKILSGFDPRFANDQFPAVVRIQDAVTGDVSRTFPGRTFALSPDGSRILVGAQKRWDWAMYDAVSGAKIYDIVKDDLLKRGTFRAFYGADGKTILFPFETRTRVLDAKDGSFLRDIRDELVTMSSDRRLGAFEIEDASGSGVGAIVVKDLETERELTHVVRPSKSKKKLRALAFSPISDRILIFREEQVQIVDVRTSEILQDLATRPNESYVVARFTPDGRYVFLSVEDGYVDVFYAETGVQIGHLKLGDRFVANTTFSPDGEHLVMTHEFYDKLQMLDRVHAEETKK